MQFYKLNYPELLVSQLTLVEKTVAVVQDKFGQNIFPLMKVSWQAYPDNICHLNFSGRFRYHNGSHVSDSGETISRDCKLCHDIVIQGTPGKWLEVARMGDSLSFRHPVDIGDAWQQTPCADYHTGATPDGRRARQNGMATFVETS